MAWIVPEPVGAVPSTTHAASAKETVPHVRGATAFPIAVLHSTIVAFAADPDRPFVSYLSRDGTPGGEVECPND